MAWKKPYEEPGAPQLFLRALDSLESRPIPGTEGGFQPVFSPDGQHVAFAGWSEGKPFLRRVPVAGGAVQTVCDCYAGSGAAWDVDGSILFAGQVGPLQKVPASGGTPEPATTLDLAAGEISHRLPHLLPDGRTVLFTALRWAAEQQTWVKARTYAWRFGDKEKQLLVEGGSDGQWAPPRVFLYAREGKLLAAPFDTRSRKLAGKPSPVLEGVRHAIWAPRTGWDTGAAHVAVARDGLLAWGPGSVYPPSPVPRVWVDASGKETPLEGATTADPGGGSRISSDGQRVLLFYFYPGRQAEVLNLARRSHRRATFDANPGWAIWGPGPDRITFTSDHEGPLALYTRRVDAGPGEIEALWRPPEGPYLSLGSWSRDGKTRAFVRPSTIDKSKTAIWLLETGKEPRPFSSGRFHEMWPDISPDGLWLVYGSAASGRFEVFVRAISGEGGTLQVSGGAGEEPLWSRDGTRIFYWADSERGRALFRVRVRKAAGSLEFAVPERLFEGPYGAANPGHSWDVGPDVRIPVMVSVDSGGR